ncbi:MAG TPA: hypothetical protein VL945_00805 [Candidatus Saccharimonadales bacterium]|nr:hypothetical protein [Candidatus Saccharimonadales bacterium]
MGLLDLFGKKNVADQLSVRFPYTMKTEFVPYKLRSREQSSSTLIVSLKNITGEPVMASVVVNVPKQLSVDQMGLAKEKEVKLGSMAANEEKQAKIDIYGGVGTDKGEYTLTVTSFVHYRDYAHILNSMRKRTVLEAV